MRTLMMAVTVALVGCGKTDDDAGGGGGRIAKATGRATEPSREQGQPNNPPPSRYRILDRNALREIVQAFDENPLRAKDAYAGVRWRFEAKVMDITPNGGVTISFEPAPTTVAKDPKTGRPVTEYGFSFTRTFYLTLEEAKLLTRSQKYTFEATISGYELDARVLQYGPEFSHVSVVR